MGGLDKTNCYFFPFKLSESAKKKGEIASKLWQFGGGSGPPTKLLDSGGPFQKSTEMTVSSNRGDSRCTHQLSMINKGGFIVHLMKLAFTTFKWASKHVCPITLSFELEYNIMHYKVKILPKSVLHTHCVRAKLMLYSSGLTTIKLWYLESKNMDECNKNNLFLHERHAFSLFSVRFE